MNKLLTVRDLQLIFGVGKDWVYTRAKSGELPYYKVGRYIRFDVDEVKKTLTKYQNKQISQDEDTNDEQNS